MGYDEGVSVVTVRAALRCRGAPGFPGGGIPHGYRM